MFSLITTLLLTAIPNVDPTKSSIYWRFEPGRSGGTIASVQDEAGSFEAVAGKQAPVWTDDVALAVIPLTGAANHGSVRFDGGWLRVKSCPAINVSKNFTVELWAKFGPPTGKAQVLVSKGVAGPGNWHIIYQADGSVRANIFGGAEARLFDTKDKKLLPNTWYHLAATYQDIGGGKMRIRTFVNGQSRGVATGATLQDTSGGDLFIGVFTDGQNPFHGSIDELRFTPSLLKPSELLIAGSKPILEQVRTPKPIFVKSGTKIDAALRAKAAGSPILVEPDGYPYFCKYTTGLPLPCSAPAGFNPGFGTALIGSAVIKGGVPAGYQFAVKPGSQCVVAIGFFDPRTSPAKRPQRVVIDGQVVDTFDPAEIAVKQPCVRKYEVRDADGDGWLVISCSQADDEQGYTGIMNVIWLFAGADGQAVDVEQLAHNVCDTPPMYYVQCGLEVYYDLCGLEGEFKGHVGYPALSEAALARMLPMRPVPFDRAPDHAQPADPRDIVIRGDLADRINTYLDHWGTCGRDQKLPAGFLSDCGYEVSGRYLETLYMLGRLTRAEFNLSAPFDALLARQDKASKHPGAFIGGRPVRTGFIWSQGTILSGLMAYHEMTGDPRALEAAGKLADWYQNYLTNGDLAAANYFAAEGKFSKEGATVGHLGKGALEPMVWLYWRTKNPKYLDIARQMAELNRQWGGVAWMIHGDLPPEKQQYEGWHIHANLTTVRGFPWLYAATGDRSYLDDAVAACDRVFERTAWGTSGVPEQIPWKGTKFPGATPDPHDETCQTSDLLQLSYLLADFTGEGRFYDRAEQIYYNHLCYMQMHNGSFSAFNRLPGPQRGGDAWFCCGFWGAKALYETARHLYASSPGAVYVNGFMPSAVNLKLAGGTVGIDAEADIPKSGKVRIVLDPKGISTFDVNIRVPVWAKVRQVAVNGTTSEVRPEKEYLKLRQEWKAGDAIEVLLDLPLRVVLDSSWDGLPSAKVAVNGAAPVEARCVSVFRGPVILAQFRLAHGCDTNWVYTGDHPDLLDTLNSSSDLIDAGEWSFESNSAPKLTRVQSTSDGVRLEWQFTPRPGWTLKRTAVVHNEVPVAIDYESQLTAPSAEAARNVKQTRVCGVRMRTEGFADYRPAKLSTADGQSRPFTGMDEVLAAGTLSLNNGYVQFSMQSGRYGMVADDTGDHAAVYLVPETEGSTMKASCTLKITGQSQWAAPVVGTGKGA